MKNIVKIGFAGLGEHMQRGHLKHLLKSFTGDQHSPSSYPIVVMLGYFDPQIECPLTIESTEGKEVLFSLPKFNTYEELLASEVEAVFIGSPDRFHAQQLLQAIEAGKHVFCEKPMAVSLEDLSNLRNAIQLAETKGLVISSCHPRRFDPPFVWLKEFMPEFEGRIGKIHHFDYSFWYHKVTDEWKTNRSLLSDHFGHEIDIFRFLFGNNYFNASKVSDSYKQYEVMGRGEAGISFRFFGSRDLEESEYKEVIRFDGSKDSFTINLNTGLATRLLGGDQFKIKPIDYDVRFAAVNQNFIQAIQGLEKSYLTHDDLLINNASSVALDLTGEFKQIHGN